MAVSPVGNMTYINQNAQIGSMQHANAQVKLDFQAMVNLQTLQEQQEVIQEVRPAEETLEAKDEREGNGKQEKDKEDKKQANSSNTEQESITTDSDGIVHLDISV